MNYPYAVINEIQGMEGGCGDDCLGLGGRLSHSVALSFLEYLMCVFKGSAVPASFGS